MRIIYINLFSAMWLSYLAYWWAMSRDVKVTERRETVASSLTRTVVLVFAGLLLWLPRVSIPFLNERFLPRGVFWFWIGAAVTAGGLLFSIWARRHIGENWSSAVTVKQDHELITTGPYSVVRHPIYTGLLVAFVGSAVARGEWRGVLAVALIFCIFWLKLRLEEKWMRAQFGESYEAYSRRVAALVPYIF
jgi:protein-S-isoprenylcysteine O-methyltransferase Ste14